MLITSIHPTNVLLDARAKDYVTPQPLTPTEEPTIAPSSTDIEDATNDPIITDNVVITDNEATNVVQLSDQPEGSGNYSPHALKPSQLDLINGAVVTKLDDPLDDSQDELSLVHSFSDIAHNLLPLCPSYFDSIKYVDAVPILPMKPVLFYDRIDRMQGELYDPATSKWHKVDMPRVLYTSLHKEHPTLPNLGTDDGHIKLVTVRDLILDNNSSLLIWGIVDMVLYMLDYTPSTLNGGDIGRIYCFSTPTYGTMYDIHTTHTPISIQTFLHTLGHHTNLFSMMANNTPVDIQHYYDSSTNNSQSLHGLKGHCVPSPIILYLSRLDAYLSFQRPSHGVLNRDSWLPYGNFQLEFTNSHADKDVLLNVTSFGKHNRYVSVEYDWGIKHMYHNRIVNIHTQSLYYRTLHANMGIKRLTTLVNTEWNTLLRMVENNLRADAAAATAALHQARKLKGRPVLMQRTLVLSNKRRYSTLSNNTASDDPFEGDDQVISSDEDMEWPDLQDALNQLDKPELSDDDDDVLDSQSPSPLKTPSSKRIKSVFDSMTKEERAALGVDEKSSVPYRVKRVSPISSARFLQTNKYRSDSYAFNLYPDPLTRETVSITLLSWYITDWLDKMTVIHSPSSFVKVLFRLKHNVSNNDDDEDEDDNEDDDSNSDSNEDEDEEDSSDSKLGTYITLGKSQIIPLDINPEILAGRLYYTILGLLLESGDSDKFNILFSKSEVKIKWDTLLYLAIGYKPVSSLGTGTSAANMKRIKQSLTKTINTDLGTTKSSGVKEHLSTIRDKDFMKSGVPSIKNTLVSSADGINYYLHPYANHVMAIRQRDGNTNYTVFVIHDEYMKNPPVDKVTGEIDFKKVAVVVFTEEITDKGFFRINRGAGTRLDSIQKSYYEDGKFANLIIDYNTPPLLEESHTYNVPVEKAAFDIESFKDASSNNRAYAAGVRYKDVYKSFYIGDPNCSTSEDLLISLIMYLVDNGDRGKRIFYAHNLGRFDGVLLLKVAMNMDDIVCTPMYRGTTLISLVLRHNHSGNWVRFHDSLLLLTSSLSKLGTMIGNDNIKGDFPHDFVTPDVLHYVGPEPTNINGYQSQGRQVWSLKDECLTYLKQDVDILFNVINDFADKVMKKTRIDIRDTRTIASLAYKDFLTNHYNSSKNPVHILPYSIARDISQSYFGGVSRRYGDTLVNGYAYDVVSMYPYAMKMDMPVGNPSYHAKVDLTNFFGFVKCIITAPSYYTLRIPILPRKSVKGPTTVSRTPETWEGWYFAEEVRDAIKYGYTAIPLCGYEFQRSSDLFKSYVDTHFADKKTATDPVVRQTSKLLLNSLYGRFGMKTYSTRTAMVSESDINNLEAQDYLVDPVFSATDNSPITSGNKTLVTHSVEPDPDLRNLSILTGKRVKPVGRKIELSTTCHISSAITAYARIFLNQFKNLEGNDLFYTDTDSVFLQHKLPDSVVGNKLGDLDLQYEISKAIFLRPKFYCMLTKDGKYIAKGVSDQSQMSIDDYEKVLETGHININRFSMVPSMSTGEVKTKTSQIKMTGIVKYSDIEDPEVCGLEKPLVITNSRDKALVAIGEPQHIWESHSHTIQ